MKSIQESIRIIKPQSFELVEKTLTDSEYNSFLMSIRQERKTTFRINNLLSSKQDVLKNLQKSPIKTADFPLIPDAYIVTSGTLTNLTSTEAYSKGHIYVQGLSSQIPPMVLDAQQGEYILDLAAAPGSKTTQIAAMMKNKGVIDAIEPDFIRKERLEYNIAQMGANIINVYQDRGERFLSNVKDRYDRVLLDAPCSGEGRFNVYDKSSYYSYRLSEVPKFANLQRKLLFHALQSVKPGGIVVYSTCTLNIIENEEVLNEVCNKFSCEILEPLKKLKDLQEYSHPVTKNDITKFRSDISNAVRIIPSTRIEGFFIAAIRKNS